MTPPGENQPLPEPRHDPEELFELSAVLMDVSKGPLVLAGMFQSIYGIQVLTSISEMQQDPEVMQAVGEVGIYCGVASGLLAAGAIALQIKSRRLARRARDLLTPPDQE